MRQGLILLGTVILANFGCSHSVSSRCEAIFDEFKLAQKKGDNKLALDRATLGTRTCTAENDPAWYWKFYIRRAQTLNDLDQDDEALRVLAQDPPQDNAYAEVRAQRRMDQSWVAYRRASYSEAGSLLDQAARDASLAGSRRSRLQTEIAVRKTYIFAETRDLEGGRSLISHLDPAGFSGDILFAYGYLLLKTGRYEESAHYFEEALPDYERNNNQTRLARLFNNLGGAYYHLGDLDRAESYLTKAKPVFQNGSDRIGLRIWLNALGVINLERGNFDRANTFLTQALGVAQSLHDKRAAEAEVLTNLAQSAIGAGRWDDAEQFNNRALAIKHRLGDPEAELYARNNEAKILIGRKDFDRALATLDAASRQPFVNPALRIETETAFLSIYAELHNEPQARAHYLAALALSDRVRSEMLKDENKLAWYSSQNSLNQQWVRFLVESKHVPEALEAAEFSRARLMLERMGEPAALAGRRASQYQQLARIYHATIVSYWLAPDQSYAWVIQPDRIELCTLPGEQKLVPLVFSYLEFLQRLSDPLHSDHPAAARLREAILDPVLPHLKGWDRVILVPDGALNQLNLETLPVDGHYWIDDVSLTITPSLNILSPNNLSPNIASPLSESTAQSPALLAIGDASPTPEFPHLPSASRELETIAALFPGRSTVLRGAVATPSAYLHSSDNHAYIHFAAHASASSQFPLESAVILSPDHDSGRLTARELLDKPMHAELVSISACESAGVRSYHGEGLVGFAWVFLQTGARGVIAGLWDASDDATARIMGGLYARIAKGSPPAAALRAAKLELVHSRSHFDRPYYWGPFQYYLGSGREHTAMNPVHSFAPARIKTLR